MASSTQNALLRAEWSDGSSPERTTVYELTATTAFVVTEKLPAVGTHVDLRLSFAGLATIDVRGLVSHVRMSLDPGAPAGFAVEFDGDDKTRAAVTKLLRATRPRPDARRRTIRVLHVDPSRLLRDMFSYAITKYFASKRVKPELLQAPDIHVARAMIDSGDVHVVQVDNEIQSATGDQIVKHARATLGPAAWIVGVGLGGTTTRDRMLAAGADVYVQKPIVLTDVLYSIELLMREEVRDALGAA